MVAEPAVTPVTTPVELTVATPVLLLLHTPPVGDDDSAVVEVAHTVVLPVIGDTTGNACTVNEVVRSQPAAEV